MSRERQKPAKATTYIVRKGDNLGRIASKYGVSVNAIRRANGIKGDNIQIGQKLTIPSKAKAKSKGKKSSRRRRR